MEEFHINFLLRFIVESNTSKPELRILPTLLSIVEKPKERGIGRFNSISLVVLEYHSILPKILLFKIPKSSPRSNCSEVSHFRLGFAMREGATDETWVLLNTAMLPVPKVEID